MNEPTVTSFFSGEVRYLEVALPGRPAVTVAKFGEEVGKEELVKRAEKYWERKDRIDSISELLRRKYNRQVYSGFLPTKDISTSLVGHYVYVLKDRKSQGKYLIQEAVKV